MQKRREGALEGWGATDRDARPALSKQGRGRERRLGGSVETTMQSEEHQQGCWGPHISQEGACLSFPNMLRYRSGVARGRAGSGFQGLGTWLLKLLPSEVCKPPSRDGHSHPSGK